MSAAGRIVTCTTSGALSTSGGKLYPASIIDPLSPTPADGDLYFNTSLGEWMFYDATRSKWLSIATFVVFGGRAGPTSPGVFYRGVAEMSFDATKRGVPVYRGTLISISIMQATAITSKLETLANGVVIDILPHYIIGATRNDAVNADFDAGIMHFRNDINGNATFDVQIAAVYRRRV